MDCSIVYEYEEEVEANLSHQSQKNMNMNGLGFVGGPAWDYPEEEIEFFPAELVVDDIVEEDSEIESCSCSTSMDSLRLQMIENYIETHDSVDVDFDLFFNRNSKIVEALSQPPSSVTIDKNSPEIITDCDSDLDEHDSTTFEQDSVIHCSSNEDSPVNKRSLPMPISPLSLNKESDASIRPLLKRRRRPDKVSINDEAMIIEEPKVDRFREATLCVPFEYTTKLATFYIRRPYGSVTTPELFRALSPHTTDQEYKKTSQVSSPKTIEVAISIAADKSMMLLYGSAGVRYQKTNLSGHRSDKWTNVSNAGLTDAPLGYVHYEKNSNAGNQTIEYSLDEILEQAMFVREQYCSTVISAALEAEYHQMMGTEKAPSPPSLAKSAVSTPPRGNNFYYDGSSNNTKMEEQDDSLKGRKLDFVPYLSPSLMTKKSSETGLSKRSSKQITQKRKRQVVRFFQKIVMVIGFYICGISLVGSLSGVGYILPSTFMTKLLPPSYKAGFEMLPSTAVPEETKSMIDGKELEDERDTYKRDLDTTQELLRKQVGETNAFAEKYDLERAKTEELEKREEDAFALVQNLLVETENLSEDLEIERVQRQKLEQTIRELELQIQTLTKDKASMESALSAQPLKEELERTEPSKETASEVVLVEFMDGVGENRSFEETIDTHHDLVDGSIRGNQGETFVSTVKSAIVENFNKIVLFSHEIGRDHRLEMDLVGDDAKNPFLAQHTLKFKDDNKKLREMFKSATDKVSKPNSPLAAQHTLKFNDDNQKLREMFKQTTEKVLKEGKERSDKIRRNVMKNVDEAAFAAIQKMDRGQEAIQVVGEFAKAKLQTAGKKARTFFSNKWKEVRAKQI